MIQTLQEKGHKKTSCDPVKKYHALIVLYRHAACSSDGISSVPGEVVLHGHLKPSEIIPILLLKKLNQILPGPRNEIFQRTDSK